ncbi:MAG: NUDIX domain-containing protein [Candidatus Dormibacteria bacterium]
MSAEAIDPLRETRIERREIHDGRLLHVFDDTVRLENGRVARRELVEHPGAVCIVPVDSEGRVGLVRQWRHPIERPTWEIPAGTRDHPGEPPEATAARELAEEMNVAAISWRHLGAWPLAPGYSSEVMHFYMAGGISAAAGSTDEDEQVERAWCTPEDVRRHIVSGDVDIKTIAALAMAGFTVALEPGRAVMAADG